MSWIDRLVRALSLLGLLAFALATKKCSKDDVGSPAAVTTERAAELVERGAVAAVVVERGVVAVASKRPDGTVKTETRYVPPEGRAEVIIDAATPSGGPASARLRVKDKGVCFSPGLYGGLSLGSRGLGANYGLGAKLVYWGRFGLDAGVSGPDVAAFAAVSYIPGWCFGNTSLYLGGNTREEIVGGFTIRF